MHTIIATQFTPYQSLAGGVLIGLASVLLMLGLGRVFGATGIIGGLIQTEGAGDRSWRFALLAGMVSAPLIVFVAAGWKPEISQITSTPMLIIGGLIVGFGASIGSGCTSGHGVCGMARLSRRSFIATLVFMAVTAITVFAIRHVI